MWLRLAGCGCAAAAISAVMFASLGHATAPATIRLQTLAAHPEINWPHLPDPSVEPRVIYCGLTLRSLRRIERPLQNVHTRADVKEQAKASLAPTRFSTATSLPEIDAGFEPRLDGAWPDLRIEKPDRPWWTRWW